MTVPMTKVVKAAPASKFVYAYVAALKLIATPGAIQRHASVIPELEETHGLVVEGMNVQLMKIAPRG